MPVTKAPAGGMVVNNSFARGGQFLAKPLARVSLVMKRLRAMKLARKPEATPAEPFAPGTFTQKELFAPAGGEPHGKTFSMAQIRAIEDFHNLPPEHRLSNKAKLTADGGIESTKDDALRFLHAVRKSAEETVPGLRVHRDADAGALAVHHLAAEAGHAMFYPHGQDAKTWYGTHVGELEKTVGKHFGWTRTDPRHTLFKALVALTSSGQNPKMNALTAFKILNQAKGDFTNLPRGQTERLGKFHHRFHELHGKHPEGLPDPIDDPQAAARWYYQHLHAHPELHDQFYGVPASVFRHKHIPDHPMNGRVAALDRSGKMVPTAEGPDLWRAAGGDKSHFEKVVLPRPDERGRVRAKSWTQRGEAAGDGVDTLVQIVRHFNGDHAKAAKWLLTDHTPAEFAAVTGSGPQAGYLKKEQKLPGSFAFGPKFGPFLLNLHTGTMPELGKYLTPDLWWSRTWNRFLGSLVSGAGKIREAPKSDKERRAMYDAAKKAAAATITPQGDTLTVAELQAVLWYHEQRMMRHLGVKADSFSCSDGARAIEKFLRGGK